MPFTIRTKPSNGATQVRYAGDPIQGYLLSLWTDGRYRLTNPTTGNIARTFRDLNEVADYRREMNKRDEERAAELDRHERAADENSYAQGRG